MVEQPEVQVLHKCGAVVDLDSIVEQDITKVGSANDLERVRLVPEETERWPPDQSYDPTKYSTLIQADLAGFYGATGLHPRFANWLARPDFGYTSWQSLAHLSSFAPHEVLNMILFDMRRVQNCNASDKRDKANICEADRNRMATVMDKADELKKQATAGKPSVANLAKNALWSSVGMTTSDFNQSILEQAVSAVDPNLAMSLQRKAVQRQDIHANRIRTRIIKVWERLHDQDVDHARMCCPEQMDELFYAMDASTLDDDSIARMVTSDEFKFFGKKPPKVRPWTETWCPIQKRMIHTQTPSVEPPIGLLHTVDKQVRCYWYSVGVMGETKPVSIKTEDGETVDLPFITERTTGKFVRKFTEMAEDASYDPEQRVKAERRIRAKFNEKLMDATLDGKVLLLETLMSDFLDKNGFKNFFNEHGKMPSRKERGIKKGERGKENAAANGASAASGALPKAKAKAKGKAKEGTPAERKVAHERRMKEEKVSKTKRQAEKKRKHEQTVSDQKGQGAIRRSLKAIKGSKGKGKGYQQYNNWTWQPEGKGAAKGDKSNKQSGGWQSGGW
jgi:hypothetical protein